MRQLIYDHCIELGTEKDARVRNGCRSWTGSGINTWAGVVLGCGTEVGAAGCVRQVVLANVNAVLLRTQAVGQNSECGRRMAYATVAQKASSGYLAPPRTTATSFAS